MDKPERPTRKILLCTHPSLRRKAQTVKRVDKDIRTLLDEMVEAMHAAPGIGLALTQVGESIRCCVVETPDEDTPPRKLVNPRVMDREGMQCGPEGCLSLPTLQGDVERAEKITVKALDERGRPDTFEAEGIYARCIQHEIDHLDGIMFIDRIIPETLCWQVPDDEEEDGVRHEETTVEDALAIFARIQKERDAEGK